MHAHLILGLGNPGKDFVGTRHNVGFSFLERLREEWGFPTFRDRSNFRAACSDGTFETGKVILALPNTFMNRSGDAARNISQFYKIGPEHIAVVHDDLDIPLGSVRESFGSRSAGHNGVEDIIGALGTKDFMRFRIGIGENCEKAEGLVAEKRDVAQFVLEPFPSDELLRARETFPEIISRLQSWIRDSR